MKVIRVYGRLAQFLGRRVFRAEVTSAAEAVRFLLANFPQLEPHMLKQHYRVRLARRSIDRDDLHEPAGSSEISLIPVIGGAGGVGRIIAGVALVALSIVSFGAGAFAGIGAAGAWGSSILGGVGASLALGGVAQLLSPVPRIAGPGASALSSNKSDNNDPRKNYSFSGIQNTSRQGVPVPVIYGEMIVGSVVISAGIDIDQVAA